MAADTIRPNLVIGGTGAGQANTISGNSGDGVAVGANTSDASVAVSVVGNSIFGNTGERIDLASDGPTANGPAGSARTGPNTLVNYPTIVSAHPGSLIVAGTYEGAANSAYTLDFYTSSAADGPQTWAGSGTVTTGADGTASFSFQLNAAASLGTFVSGTATDASGSTSEFDTAAVTITPGPPGAPGGGDTPTAADTQPPTAPGQLRVRLVVTPGGIVQATLELTWLSATDNVGVDHYTLLRDGKPLPANLSGSTTTALSPAFSATGNKLSSPNIFTLVALDATGNQSPPVTATVVALKRPTALPLRIPNWAWPLLRWQHTATAKRGARPAAAPQTLPAWYGRWATWRLHPARLNS